MSMVNTNVKQTYACNGVTQSFAIPFAWYDIPQIIVHRITVANGTRLLLVEGVDYTLDPAFDPIIIVNPDPMAPPPIPTVVTTTAIYSASYQIEVSRSTPLTQIVSYINNSDFNAEDHEAGMNRIVMMMQELAAYVGETFTDIDALIADLEAQIIAATGLPAGGDEFALLEKNSAADTDARWTDPIVAVGYSARYAQNVNLEGTKALLDFIFNIQYAGPGVTFTANTVSNSLREKGTAVTATTLQAALVKNTNAITEVRFFRNPSTLLATQTSGGGIPNGGNSTYAWTGSFTDDTVFRVEVDDGATTETRTLTFPFVYPYYTGVGAAGLGAGVSALTKLVITSTASLNRSFTVNGSQKMYFAYPASYGALTKVFDVNNFDTLADWTLTTTNITGLDGNPVSYRIYEFNNFAVAGTYSYTFVR